MRYILFLCSLFFTFNSFCYSLVGSFKFNYYSYPGCSYWSYTPAGSNPVNPRSSLARSTGGADLVFELNKRYFVKVYCGGYSTQHGSYFYRLIFNAGGVPSGGYYADGAGYIDGEIRVSCPYNSAGWYDSPVFYFSGSNNSMQFQAPYNSWGVGYIYEVGSDVTLPPTIDLPVPVLPQPGPDNNVNNPPVPDDSDIDPVPDGTDPDNPDDEKDSITVPPAPEEPEIKPLDPMKPIFDRYKGVSINVPGQGNFIYPRFGIPLPNDQVVHVGIADGLSNSDISDSFSFIQDIVKGLGYVLISVLFFKSTLILFRKNS